MKKAFIATCSLFCFSFLASSCGNNDEEKPASYRNKNIANHNANPKEVQQSFPVTASEMCNDFRNSQVNALNKYNGNLIALSGTVQLTQTLESDCHFVTLACSDDPKDSVGMVIRCCVQSGVDLSKVKAGDQITVEAKFKEIDKNVISLEEGVIK